MTLCCGCREQRGTIRVERLGFVCHFCNEVLPIVFAEETRRVKEAIAVIDRFLLSVDEEKHD